MIIETDKHLFDKIRYFTNRYITFKSKHSYIPAFIIQELNRNPNIIKDKFISKVENSINIKFVNQINELVQRGDIIPIKPEQLFINIISMSVFPFIAKPLLCSVLNKSKEEYNQLIEERKTEVAEFIINAIKTK